KVTDEVLGVSKIIRVEDGLEASVRTHELRDGWVLKPDVEVATNDEGGWQGPAIQAAVKLLNEKSVKSRKVAATGQSLPIAVWHEDESYAKMFFPTLEYRLLALFRFWNAIKFFYPYLELLEQDWDTLLSEFIPRMERVEDARGYLTTLQELVFRIPDAH